MADSQADNVDYRRRKRPPAAVPQEFPSIEMTESSYLSENTGVEDLAGKATLFDYGGY